MTREEAARVLKYLWIERDENAKLMQQLTTRFFERQEALRMGAAALRGPQPDPITGLVPCDFCTDTFGQKPLLQENKYEPYTRMMSTISIEENNGKHQIEIDLWDGGNVYAAFEINYCPMCGRKLEVKG